MNHLFFLLSILIAFNTPSGAEERIVFYGDSLTAGFGLASDEAYPALIQDRLTREGFHYLVKNAGVSGDTSAGGLRRLKWALKEEPAIFVLALGANDGLRGTDLEETRKNLNAIIAEVRHQYPRCLVIVAGMELPINLGEEYRKEFRELFAEVAQEMHAPLIPFLLDGVAGSLTLNQADGIHPTAEGQKIIAENVWKILKPLLQKSS